jgi:hypothetical protein
MTARTRKSKSVKSNISPDWAVWGRKLTETLAKLKEDEYLIISAKRGQRMVQYAGQGAFGMRVETSSNEYLLKGNKLSTAQIKALVEAGWHKPTHKSTSKVRTAHGSPNFYVDVKAPVPYEKVAELTVRTLAGVLKVLHPGNLQYDAFESNGRPLDFPELGLKRSMPEEEGLSQARLLEMIREITGIRTFEYDKNGEIPVAAKNVVIYVSLIESGTHVRFRTHLLNGIEKQPGLLESLNDLNAKGALVRYAHAGGTIASILDVPASPCSKGQLAGYLSLCAELGNAMSASFRAQFGGSSPVAHPLASNAIH